MRDRAGVGGCVPLHLDGVACLGRDGGDARRYLVAVDVAGDVVARHVGHRTVAGWHADANLVAWRHAIDPELVEVLVRGDAAQEEGDGDGRLGKHGEGRRSRKPKVWLETRERDS